MTLFENDRQRLSRILTRADAARVTAMAQKIQASHDVAVVKEPGKTLAMIQLRDTVRATRFYLGEVIVWEAVVELDGARGMAATMDDSAEKALAMAVIDAAVSRGVFEDSDALLALEAEQAARDGRENALHRQTMVQFTSMDAEMPT